MFYEEEEEEENRFFSFLLYDRREHIIDQKLFLTVKKKSFLPFDDNLVSQRNLTYVITPVFLDNFINLIFLLFSSSEVLEMSS